jgi:hypothetical protein
VSAGFNLAGLVKAELAHVADELAAEAKANIEARMPIDTGFAESHVEVVASTDFLLSLEISDAADYVTYLNAGSSPQAEANFVEDAVSEAVDTVNAREASRNRVL